MQKVKLAVCIGDKEYEGRFLNCLMKHYPNQFELYVLKEPEGMEPQRRYDVILASDLPKEGILAMEKRGEPLVYLFDSRDSSGYPETKEAVLVEKYQEVNRIMEKILSCVSEEGDITAACGTIPAKARRVAVYSLTETGYQLPFALLMGGILGEKEKVLFIDMQEHSGFSQVREKDQLLGLEDFFIMAAGGNYSRTRMLSGIGRLGSLDYVYPVEQGEFLGEIQGETCRNMLAMIDAELEYDVILVNLGTYFPGFVNFLSDCHSLYLLEGHGGSCPWREASFLKEMEQSGNEEWKERIHRVEIPALSGIGSTYEELADQWKWNEMGELIRRITAQYAGMV